MKKIAYILGILPNYPDKIRPLPPLDSGAPHSNIMRMLNAVYSSDHSDVHITVISPKENDQHTHFNNKRKSAGSATINYEWIIIPKRIRKLSNLFGNRLSWKILSVIFGVYTIKDLYYTRKLTVLLLRNNFDVVFLDDGPQLIKALAKKIKPSKFIFYLRAHIGTSRRFLHLPDQLVVASELTGQWAMSLNHKLMGYQVIPNSLNKSFLGVKYFSGPKKETLLYVGRIAQLKGVIQLYQAFAILNQNSKLQINLTVVGSAKIGGQLLENTPYETELSMFLSGKKMEGNVIRHPWVSGEQLKKFYKSAKLAVFPSICHEAFGMVALEAMACGCPVLVSDRPGFKSLVGQNEERGWLIPDPENIEEFSGKLQYILNNYREAIAKAEEAYDYARQFTAEKSKDRLFQVLLHDN